jgi:DNA-binding NtrC family response regulator
VESRTAPERSLGRILVVDDDPSVVSILTKYFSDAGYSVDAAAHGGDALIAVSQYQPDVVVLDILMEGLNGVQVLEQIRSLDPKIRVIMITGSGDASFKPTAMSMGAFAYVSKPVSLERLHEAVTAAFTPPGPRT